MSAAAMMSAHLSASASSPSSVLDFAEHTANACASAEETTFTLSRRVSPSFPTVPSTTPFALRAEPISAMQLVPSLQPSSIFWRSTPSSAARSAVVTTRKPLSVRRCAR